MSSDLNPDTTLLNWVEAVGCQIWRTPEKKWVASVRHPKKYIQPTKSTLREAIISARDDYFRFEQQG